MNAKVFIFLIIGSYASAVQYIWDVLKPPLNGGEVAAILASKGEDMYPMYNQIPETDFECSSKKQTGFYADVETRCQVFHRCDLNGNRSSYLCVNSTVFNQITLTCDYFFNVDCQSFVKFENLANSRLYTDQPLFDNPPANYIPAYLQKIEWLRGEEKGQTQTRHTTKPPTRHTKPTRGSRELDVIPSNINEVEQFGSEKGATPRTTPAPEGFSTINESISTVLVPATTPGQQHPQPSTMPPTAQLSSSPPPPLPQNSTTEFINSVTSPAISTQTPRVENINSTVSDEAVSTTLTSTTTAASESSSIISTTENIPPVSTTPVHVASEKQTTSSAEISVATVFFSTSTSAPVTTAAVGGVGNLTMNTS